MEPARNLSPNHPPTAWPTAWPAWIEAALADRSVRLRAEPRHLLRVCAGAVAPTGPDDDRVPIYGGPRLAARAGCSVRSLWRRLGILTDAGFLVLVCRGGWTRGRAVVNVYGMPGRPGSLDRFKARARNVIMVEGTDGIFRPEIRRAGDPPTLFDSSIRRPKPPPKVSRTSVTLSPKSVTDPVTLHPQSVTPPYGVTDGITTNGGSDGVLTNKNGPGDPDLNRITVADLTDTGRTLILFAQAVDRGWVDDSEHDRLSTVAAACYAIRRGRNAPALFRRLIIQKNLWGFPILDERAAADRIKRELYPDPDPTRGGWTEDFS